MTPSALKSSMTWDYTFFP